MSIGSTSTYPNNKDSFYNVYDQYYSGYPVADELKTIPSGTYQITLNHLAKEDTISIPGYAEVKSPTVPAQGEFVVTDYAIPSSPGSVIDYNIGKAITFHSTASGNTIKASYITPGDKVTAVLLNKLIDSLNNIETILGTIGSGKNLDTGSYNTLCDWLSYFFTVFQSHTHSGASTSGSTRQLTEGSLADGSIVNAHIKSTAAIGQSKLEKGILDNDIDFIPTGTDKYVDITSASWATSNKIVMLTRGANGYTDPGDVGSLSYEELVTADGFRVNFFSDTATLVSVIPFTWILR
jgi:hypothetical protein